MENSDFFCRIFRCAHDCCFKRKADFLNHKTHTVHKIRSRTSNCSIMQGSNFLYFSAGLGNIDETIYERASVDGASGVQQFFSLTLPGLSPIMFYTVVVNIIQAFQSFGQIKILTEGGPNESTNVIVYSIYRDAFFNYRFGSASAQSVILFVIIMLVTLVMFRIEKKGVNY